MAYIPKAHEKYHLLPLFVETNLEVILIPETDAFQIAELLPDGELIWPCNELSEPIHHDYAEYYAKLDSYLVRFGTAEGKLNDLGKLIEGFKKNVQQMNVKENWSVLKYIGEENGDEFQTFTSGWHYYMACSDKPRKILGIIDDDGFEGAYDNDTNSSIWERIAKSWEIVEDPSGMATQLFKK